MTGKDWCVEVSLALLKRADQHERTATELIDVALLATACAQLPEELAMRVRLLPDAFSLRA